MWGTAQFALLAAAVSLGALVQGSVGLGLGLVAAPIVTLVDASLMPGVMLCLAAVLPLLTLAHEWRATDWRGIGWSLSGRLPGTLLGVLVVSAVSTRLLGLLVGCMVLVAVALTVRVVRLPMRPAVLLGAGAVSGVTGTATSIGGPPVALVYQHVSGPRLRATMAAYFMLGSLVSLAALAAAGELRAEQATTALALSPFLLVGFGLAQVVRRYVDAGRTRSAVLGVCAASATVLLVRSILG